MKRSTGIVAVIMAATCLAANAQSDLPGGPDPATRAGQPASEVSPQQREFLQKLRALDWVKGPSTASVEGNARLVIPERYLFLDAANTRKFLELQHNLGDGKEVMVAPQDMHWMAYLEFSDAGYVKDDEKIDAPALLKTLKENTEKANTERQRRGWAPLHVVDWAVPPVYNTATKRLEWATTLEESDGRGVNFSTKILGRRGYTSVIMVTDPGNLTQAEEALDHVLSGYAFNAGETYSDWRSGDKVAEYGLAALIVGGAAVIAAKKGLFTVLMGFLAVAWKFVAAGAVAAIAWLRSLFAKKRA